MDYAAINTSNTSNQTEICAILTADQVKELSKIRGICGVAAAGLILFVVVTPFIVRALGFCMQLCTPAYPGELNRCRKALNYGDRLFVYVSLAGLLPSIAFALHGFQHAHISEYEHARAFCQASAFLVQTFECSEMLILLAVVISLFVSAWRFKSDARRHEVEDDEEAERNPLLPDHVSVQDKEPNVPPGTCITKGCILEATFILTFAMIPLVFTWVPFLPNLGDYGEAGPWCWITSVKLDCTDNEKGFWEQIGIWYVFLLLVFVPTMIVTFLTCYCAYSNKLPSKPNTTRIGFLAFYFLVLYCYEAVEFVFRLVDYMHHIDIYPLWAFYAVVTPLSKVVPTVAFAVLAGHLLPKGNQRSPEVHNNSPIRRRTSYGATEQT